MAELKEGSKDLKQTIQDIERILHDNKKAIDEVIVAKTKEAALTVSLVSASAIHR